MYHANDAGILLSDRRLVTQQRKIVFPPAHSPNQNILYRAFLTPGLLEVWFACGSKYGKSFGVSAGLTAAASIRGNGGLYRWIAPIYTQAKIGYKYCKKNMPGPPDVIPNKSDPSLTYAHTETRIEFKSAKNSEDLEGEATNGNVLDEAAKMPEQAYTSVKTTTTVTRGPIVPISTPRGKNWFHRGCMNAKDIMLWQIKHNKPLTHIFVTAPSTDNPAVTTAAIDEMRRALPERLFRQYVLAEFLDDGAVFVGFRDCIEEMPEISLENDKSQLWYHQDAETAPVVIGADWAKTSDRTVFWAIDLRTRRCVGFWRYYKTPYTQAIRRLVKFSNRFADVVAVLHDKTGLGNVLDDYLAETELPYEGVTFSNPQKCDLVTRLITGLEQQDTFLPNWPEMIHELDVFEVITTLAGNPSYGAPSGEHDDIVIAMALAYTLLVQYGDREYEVKFVEDTTRPQVEKPATVEADGEPEAESRESALTRFYKEMADDADDED